MPFTIAKSPSTAVLMAFVTATPLSERSRDPLNLAACDQPDGAALAAAYPFGVARNHGFLDGNERTAWILARLLFAHNGFKF